MTCPQVQRVLRMGISSSTLWAVAFCAAAAARAPGEEPPTGGAPRTEEPPSPPTAAPASDAYKPLGPSLFPLYEHYLRTADGTSVRNILYLYNTTEHPSGSWSTLFLPFFYRGHEAAPPVDYFFLLPFLYFHKSSEAESYDYALPLFYHRSTPEGSFRLLVPFWVHSGDPVISNDHVLFPLFRYRESKEDPSRPVEASRFGLWKILELWESRVDPASRGYAALNFFNWSEETQGGLPLYRYSWEGSGDQHRGSTYLFPFYWHGREAGSEYNITPFYGQSTSPGGIDHYVPILLSRIGSGAGESRVDLLYPLFHYRADSKSTTLYSFPSFRYSADEAGSAWNILYFLYRTSFTASSGKRTHSVLFPLSNYDVEPDGSSGAEWALLYILFWNQERLWRLFPPLYLEYQTLAGGKTDWFFRLGLPVYLSWGYPDDNFAMGFPLFWAFRDGPRGLTMFLPLYYHIYSAASWSTHLIPLFNYISTPSRKQLFLLGPLYINERFYGHEGSPAGTGHHILWPLIGVASRDDGYLYKFLPFFSKSKEGDSEDLLITPFYYVNSGPQGKHRYFIPIYGRYEAENLARDYYALGTYIRTREWDGAGKVTRTRDDILWSLLSWEADEAAGSSHRHILPLAYWETQTPVEDRTIAGPLYYSHRYVDGDETHHLNLVLGNLFYSSVIEGPLPVEPPPPAGEPPAGSPPPGEPRAAETESAARATAVEGTSRLAKASGEGAPGSPVERPAAVPGDAVSGDAVPGGAAAPQGSLYPLSDRSHPPGPPRGEIYRDEGVLWPLARSYRSVNGEEGTWCIPFYFNLKDDTSSTLALWPFYFRQHESDPYDASFFRYLFLFDRETWRGGHRWTLGQILVDWKEEETSQEYRLRLLYPLIEHAWTKDSYAFQFTPLFVLSAKESSVENRFFPLYWQGSTSRRTREGKEQIEDSYFFLFPLFGYSSRPTRTDYNVLFPIFHLLSGLDSFRFELWPILFCRDEADLFALRVWPLHADESKVSAGDFWVSRYLFLSKRFRKDDGWSYRLDPFIFRVSGGPDESSVGGLFELMAHWRKGQESSFRVLPLAFGSSGEKGSETGIIPLYYRRDFGPEEIDYMLPWRFTFLVHNLEGQSGERHTGVLWKLFEHTDNPNRPEYHETAVLHRLFFQRSTETSRELQFNLLFSYYRNDADDETQFSFLLYLYSYKTVRGQTSHRLFYFLEF